MTQLAAQDIMTKDVLTARAEWTIQTLADFFLSKAISGAPVLNNKEELVGVVSVTDLLRYNSSNSGGIHERPDTHDFYLHGLEGYSQDDIKAMRIDDTPKTLVKDIMTTVVFDVEQSARAQDVASTMIKGRIHRVFVTDNKKVVGVVSAHDMLKIVRNLP